MTGHSPGHFYRPTRRNNSWRGRKNITNILHEIRAILLSGRDNMEKKRYRVTITVGGESYTIRGETEPERVQKVAALFDERLRQTERSYPTLSPAKTAVLTGLNLTEEYLRLQEDYQQMLSMLKQVK